MNRRLRIAAHTLLVPIALALALAACGDDGGGDGIATLGDDTSTEEVSDDNGSDGEVTEEERQQAMLDFAQCMRDHGVDMADPQFDEQGRGGVIVSGAESSELPDEETMKAAQDACQPLMEDVIGRPGDNMDPEEVERRQQEALEFAQCMRDHGIDFPDPQFQDGGAMTQRLDVDPSDPDFQAAQEECAGTNGGPFTVGGPGGSATNSSATNSSAGGDE
jgi:hypothetical protein